MEITIKNMFGNNKIYNRIMDAVKEKLNLAQKEYDDGVEKLQENLEKDIVELEEKIVSKFINKIL